MGLPVNGGIHIGYTRYNDVEWLYAPWCWNIYLHDWVIYGVNVGKHAICVASGNGSKWFLQLEYLDYPVVRRKRHKERLVYSTVFIFPIDSLFNGEPRRYSEFPNHLLLVKVYTVYVWGNSLFSDAKTCSRFESEDVS